jgi:hypothetical protein
VTDKQQETASDKTLDNSNCCGSKLSLAVIFVAIKQATEQLQNQ